MAKGFLRTEYSFTSGSGEIGSARYITEYQVRIFSEESYQLRQENREYSIEIGKGWVSLFLLGLAMDNQQPLIDVFDDNADYLDLYQVLYTKQGELIQPIQNDYESFNGNLLFIRQLELLPEWRSRGLGKKVLKDIILRFDGCCGLVVMNSSPLQFESGILESTDLWNQQLLLNQLTQDKKLAQQKLAAFCQSVGFERVPDSTWHYLSLGKRNAAFDQIAIDETDEL